MKKKPTNGQWHDRLVRTGFEAPDQLLGHPQNPKIHPMAQTAAVKGAISELGWMGKVKVNLRTSPDWETEQGVETVIDGHDRIKAAMQEHQPQVPVDYYDLSPAEEKLFLVTYDPIAWMAVTDKAQLDLLLRDVQTADEGLMAMLSELAQKEGIIAPQIEFKEYDESIEDEVEFCQCPQCGHRWPK